MKGEHSTKKRRAIRAAQVTGQAVGRQKEAPTEAMVEEDPLGCAQLLVCQLAATPSHLLQPNQRAVLDFARLVVSLVTISQCYYCLSSSMTFVYSY